MLIQDDIRRCVVFIGTAGDKKNGGIDCIGTGFLIEYGSYRYLVTAQHIAAGLGDNPFLIRLNKSNGTADNINIDPISDEIRWFTTVDLSVDIAITPFNYALSQSGYDSLFLHIPVEAKSSNYTDLESGELIAKIGIGDTTYTVGLFQLVAGRKRNVPVVHTGSIALMAGEESIPVSDWLDKNSGAVRYVDCHLVETSSLQGLSGAPVFVRPTVPASAGVAVNGRYFPSRLAAHDVTMLGVWQGSWEMPPGAILGIKGDGRTRVPVGMGVVVPMEKILDLLRSDEMKNHREEKLRKYELSKSASVDSIESPASGADENLRHKEDFTSLLSAAAKTQKRDD